MYASWYEYFRSSLETFRNNFIPFAAQNILKVLWRKKKWSKPENFLWIKMYEQGRKVCSWGEVRQSVSLSLPPLLVLQHWIHWAKPFRKRFSREHTLSLELEDGRNAFVGQIWAVCNRWASGGGVGQTLEFNFLVFWEDSCTDEMAPSAWCHNQKQSVSI